MVALSSSNGGRPPVSFAERLAGSDAFKNLFREGMLLVILGVGVGLALAAGSTRLLESFLFGVSSRDTLTFVATPVLLASVALAACYFPARRATRMDPMSVLRQQ